MGLVLLTCCCTACGRIGVEVVSLDAAREDAGIASAEPDVGPEPSEEPLDASEPHDGSDEAESSRVTDSDIVAEDAGDGGQAEAAPDAMTLADGSLVLRYDFSGTGTTVPDLIGSSHGEVRGGAQLDGSGSLALDGSNDFVNLPNALLSRWSSVTVMAWLTWSGGPCWQRVFDFGSSSSGEDNVGNATSSFSLSPASCPNGVVTGLFELNSDLRAVNGNAMAIGVRTQVALSLDNARRTVTLFLNGAVVGESAVPWQLSQLQDVNNWLGRSQWVQDSFLRGRLDELRIYSRALSSPEVMALHARGPDAP